MKKAQVNDMTYGCNTSRQNHTGRKPGYFARDGDRVIWIEDRMSKECRYDRSEIDKGCDGCEKKKEAGND